MRVLNRCLPVLLIGLTSIPSVNAEPTAPYFYLTPMGGVTLFDDDVDEVDDEDRLGLFRHAGEGHPIKDSFYVGGRLGHQFHRLWGIEAGIGFSSSEQDVEAGEEAADIDFSHLSANLLFTPWNGGWGGPFLSVGGGGSRFQADGEDSRTDGAFEGGAGLRFWLSDGFGLRLEARDVWIRPGEDDEQNEIILAGGLAFAFGGRAPDTDGDGVSDPKDRCPDTPRGAVVDEAGCPKDSDGDGVPDGIDLCANTPSGTRVDASGCPKDSDGDGVFDGPDQCPDTPRGAMVDAKGCPTDRDGDGVFDGIDTCADTPKGATVDAKGCPKDSDGDGVYDGIDRCPGTGAGLKVDRDGCPIEVTEKETELLDTGTLRLQDINFETGKADILPESFASLDVVGQVLSKWPELRIEVGGHTDSRGSTESNQKLSEARANSVLSYLTSKFPGLQAEQFSAKGYGESTPIASNATDLGRAKNRRVEFVVLNKDVLRKEREKRRLMLESEGK
jgi:OOP family OmpA-OmpF porin